MLLMRHAKSRWDEGVSDHDRSLEPRGQQDAWRMGSWLKDEDLAPERIIASSARRAQDTAGLVAQACGFQGRIETEERLYRAGVEDLERIIASLDDRRTLLVGHNPTFEEVVCRRAPDAVPDGKRMPTATVVVLEEPVRWVRPRDL